MATMGTRDNQNKDRVASELSERFALTEGDERHGQYHEQGDANDSGRGGKARGCRSGHNTAAAEGKDHVD